MSLFILVYIFCLGVLALIISSNALIEFSPFFYLSIFALYVANVCRKRDVVFNLFKPTTVIVLYVSFFFFMGTLAFNLEYVQMEAGDQWEYYGLQNLGIINSYFLFSLFATILTQVVTFKKNRLFIKSPHSNKYCPKNRFHAHIIGLLLSSAIMLISTIVDIPLPGGVGSFSSTFFFFAVVYVTYALKINGYRYRFIVYMFNLLLFATVFYEDRRLVAFYVFIVSFIELYDYLKVNISLKNIALSIAVSIFLVFIIIAMSIQRGVGQYETTNVIKSYAYVLDYLKSDWAVTMLFHNLEGPATTFHSYHAVSYMINVRKHSFGTTLIKSLFVLIDRSLYDDKPRSMVDEYTTTLYPSFRMVGGSYVPNLYAEFFWNFGFCGGLVLMMPLFYFLDFIYSISIEKMRKRSRLIDVAFLSSFSFIIFLFRGSGLDLFSVFALVFIIMSIVYSMCLVLINSFVISYKSVVKH